MKSIFKKKFNWGMLLFCILILVVIIATTIIEFNKTNLSLDELFGNFYTEVELSKIVTQPIANSDKSSALTKIKNVGLDYLIDENNNINITNINNSGIFINSDLSLTSKEFATILNDTFKLNDLGLGDEIKQLTILPDVDGKFKFSAIMNFDATEILSVKSLNGKKLLTTFEFCAIWDNKKIILSEPNGIFHNFSSNTNNEINKTLKSTSSSNSTYDSILNEMMTFLNGNSEGINSALKNIGVSSMEISENQIKLIK